MTNLMINDFIKDNPENWEELLQQPPYNIKISEDKDYALLKYDMINSDFGLDIVRECRGIIIDKEEGKAIALSFKKFFNYQEPYADKIDWRHCKVTEKIDGTKILVWWDDKRELFRLSTSGMLNAKDANINDIGFTYEDLFYEALTKMNIKVDDFFYALNKDYCYTFELVSPKSRIVVPYKSTKLYLIGVRKTSTMEEVELFHEATWALQELKIPTPDAYTYKTLNDCIMVAENMGIEQEGFVVVDKDWNRIKIKGEEYVLAHYTRFNQGTSYSRILSLIETGGDKDFLKIFPEYQEEFDKVREAYNSFIFKVRTALLDITNLKAEMTRKEEAQYILNNYKDIQGFCFKYLDTDLWDLFIKSEWSKIPKNNKLKFLGFKEEQDAEEFKEE